MSALKRRPKVERCDWHSLACTCWLAEMGGFVRERNQDGKQMSAPKRRPQVERCDWHKFSKADWVEVFRDLFAEACSEGTDPLDWFKDAARRRDILSRYRAAREGK